MNAKKDKKYNENKELYQMMVIRYGESYTQYILTRYTDIDIEPFQEECA